MMEKMMVLYNETSGSSESKEIAERFKKAAEAKGEAVILQPSNPDIDPEEMRKNAKESQVGVLVVIGGDGTIHHAVQNFKDTIRDYQIGIIPGGTVNNFARVLSIPLKEEDAFETILAGQTTPVDFGMVNQDVMISTLTIGLLADTAANVTQQEKQKYGPLAFTKQFFRLLMKKKKYKLKIDGDERRWHGKAQLLTMTMTNSAGGFTNFDANATPDDGEVHIIILPKLVFYKFVYYLPKIIRGQLNEIPGVVYFSGSQFKISGEKDKKVQTRTDGDPTDDLPIKVTVEAGGLNVFVPETSTSTKE